MLSPLPRGLPDHQATRGYRDFGWNIGKPLLKQIEHIFTSNQSDFVGLLFVGCKTRHHNARGWVITKAGYGDIGWHTQSHFFEDAHDLYRPGIINGTNGIGGLG